MSYYLCICLTICAYDLCTICNNTWLTICACVEGEKPTCVAPAKPVASLYQALIPSHNDDQDDGDDDDDDDYGDDDDDDGYGEKELTQSPAGDWR